MTTFAEELTVTNLPILLCQRTVKLIIIPVKLDVVSQWKAGKAFLRVSELEREPVSMCHIDQQTSSHHEGNE